jgi:hypothetical protein
MVEEAVEDGRGARHVAEQLAPVFERTVARHDRAPRLVAAHDDFEEVFTAALGELLHAHVVDDEEVRPEIVGDHGVVLAEGFGSEEVVDDVEDGTIERGATLLDGGIADSLGEVRLAGARGSHEEHIAGIFQKLAGGQFEELLARE